MKDYYAVLGVSDKATPDEMLAAWRTRSAILHPDRFDRVKQATQWQQANAMFAELREAHEILGDSRRRAEYDRVRRGAQSTSQQAPPPERPRPHEQRGSRTPEPDPQLFASRFVEASSLPLAGLRALSRAKGSDALFRKYDSGFMNAIGLVLGVVGCYLTWSAASGEQLDGSGQMWTLAGFAGALWLILFNALRLWLAHATPFGRGLVVTPYYFAEVRWDRSRLIPLIALKDVATTHHYRNGFYEKTTFRTEWVSRSLSFDIASKADSERLSTILVESANRLRQSFAVGQGEGIIKQFAFAQSVETLPREDFKSRKVKVLERELAGVVAVGAIILLALRPSQQPTNPHTLSASLRPAHETTAPASGATTPFDDIFAAPEVPFPATSSQVNSTPIARMWHR